MNPDGESTLKSLVGKPNLPSFDTNPWGEAGISKGCMRYAHHHSWVGATTLGDAIDNAENGVLKTVMYEEGEHIINIHFCKKDDCNL